jgi:hypothetical protein
MARPVSVTASRSVLGLPGACFTSRARTSGTSSGPLYQMNHYDQSGDLRAALFFGRAKATWWPSRSMDRPFAIVGLTP